MIADVEVAEYLEEIREKVCNRCIERPPGGPPCLPLGKNCGVEMHLPELIDSIHQVNSVWLEEYQEHDRKAICEKCAFLHNSICPCPMDYLAALIVEAVETVDARHQEQAEGSSPPARFKSVDRCHAVEKVAGSWTECDWPMHPGKKG